MQIFKNILILHSLTKISCLLGHVLEWLKINRNVDNAYESFKFENYFDS
jgi:hypothetical protein